MIVKRTNTYDGIHTKSVHVTLTANGVRVVLKCNGNYGTHSTKKAESLDDILNVLKK